MHDAASVGVLDCLAHLQEHVEQATQTELGQSLLVALTELFQDLVQRLTADELHGEVSSTLRIESELVNGHDVRMFELSRDLRFLDEACELSTRHLLTRER